MRTKKEGENWSQTERKKQRQREGDCERTERIGEKGTEGERVW